MVVISRVRGFIKDNPRQVALSAFSAWCILTVLYLRHVSARDPTSLFFDPGHGFDPKYSIYRTTQAENFIASVADNSVSPQKTEIAHPHLAVGIATVQRQGQRYFRAALGSILEGLQEGERAQIHLTTLIANVDPSQHQAYHEIWLHTLPDQVLTYQNATAAVQAQMAHLETTDSEHRVKPMLDYIYLLQACYDTGAEFILMLEDDVIAADGWYHRTMAALKTIRPEMDRTIYLRLFFDSGLLGWNSERWPEHLLFSSMIAIAVLVTLRIVSRYSSTTAKFLTGRATLVILGICTPAIIGLYYAAGRLTVAPLPTGVVRMDTHGCCSQAFVFPRYRVPELIAFYREKNLGFIDMLTEEYSNARGLARWAVAPSIFQHVGAKSSKGDDTSQMQWQRNVAQNIWNFDFELYDPILLRKQHAAAATKSGDGSASQPIHG